MQMQAARMIERLGPVLTVVAAALCIILGVLIIVYPVLLAWAGGISLVLVAVALLASVFTHPGR
jgi:hypothetical protein